MSNLATIERNVMEKAKVGTVPVSDILAIIRGEPYVNITFKQLEKQFGIDLMNAKLDKQQMPKKAIHAFSLVAYLASIVAIPSAFAIFMAVAAIGAVSTVSDVISMTGFAFISAIIIMKSYRHATDSIYEYLTQAIKYRNAICVVEEYDKATINIPYGASLRYDEAVDSKEFNRFLVCYPNMEELTDPAIVGITPYGEMKLIALWDKSSGGMLEFSA